MLEKLTLGKSNYLLFGSKEIGSLNKKIPDFLDEVITLGLGFCSLEHVRAVGLILHENPSLFVDTTIIPVRDEGNIRFFFFNKHSLRSLEEGRLDERKPGVEPLAEKYQWCFLVEKPELLVHLAVSKVEEIFFGLESVLSLDYVIKLEESSFLLKFIASNL